MINLFQVASQDQSIYYLSSVFGYVGSVLPVGNNPPLLLGMMFQVLNTMALTVGAFIVVYVIIVGLFKTAQEGEFLGRHWNSLWVPIRMVMGIAALFPTASGYSAIQVIIMWIIVQGIGAGDTLWTKVLQYVEVTGSPYSNVSSSLLQTSQVQSTMQTLFSSLVCQASAKATYSPVANNQAKYYCQANPSDPWCTTTARSSLLLDPINGPEASTGPNGQFSQTSNTTYTMGPGGQCGFITYCNADTTSNGMCAPSTTNPTDLTGCRACQAQQKALQSIVPTLGAIADKLVEMDNQYLNFYETAVTPQTTIPIWMQNYCTAKNILQADCCVFTGSVSGAEIACSNASSNFPSDSAKSNDYSNMSYNSDASSNTSNPAQYATDLLLKYPLQAYLNGADFIASATGEYTTAVVGAVTTALQQKMQDTALTEWRSQAQSFGWIFAGGYYYELASQNKNAQSAAALTFASSGTNTPVAQVSGNAASQLDMHNYRNNYMAVSKMLAVMQAQNNSNGSGSVYTTDPVSGALTSGTQAASASLLQSWLKSMTNNDSTHGPGFKSNPLISIATFGYQMMITAQLLFAVILVTIAAIALFGGINFMVLGTGLTMNPFGEMMKAVMGVLGPFIVLLISSLYSLGAILGIYVPLIPYMVFTMGALGWLVATVEAMAAGPIIALGILSPGGQHDILGKAEPAMMQLFNLFLRPSLMVLGMMVAMLMSIVAVELVNSGFVAVATTVISHPGLFEQLMFIAVYTSFIVTVLNKTFSLIYVIPERILTWIGGPAVQYGEQEALGAIKHSLEGAAAGATGAGKESGSAAVHGGMAVAQSKNKQEKDDSAALQAKADAAKKGQNAGGGPSGGDGKT